MPSPAAPRSLPKPSGDHLLIRDSGLHYIRFDAYDVCVRGIEPLPIWDMAKMDAGRQDCFKQTIQVNHLALPAGTTAEQAFAKYKDCLKKDAPISVTVAGLNFNGNKQNTVRQNCFTSALR